MLLFRLARPVRKAATAVAQAPVPQAIVMPLPRSHTRVRMVSASVSCANSMLQRWGNALMRDVDGVDVIDQGYEVRIAHADIGAFEDALVGGKHRRAYELFLVLE